MGLGSLVRAVRDPGWAAWARGDDFSPGGDTWAGPPVNNSTAMQLLTVYGCTALISNTIATMPVNTFRKLPDGGVAALDNPPWLMQPDLETDGITFWVMCLVSLLLKGNAYVMVMRNPQGLIVELVPVHPDTVKVTRGPDRRLTYRIGGERVGGEIVHIRAICWPGDPVGLSPLEAARQQIGAGLAVQQFGASFFKQGTAMAGVIQMPGPVPNEDTLKAIREAWQMNYGGSAKAHLPGMLFEGATWQSISVTPEQAQFLETQRFSSLTIAANVFQVPPDFVGLAIEGSSLTYQNIESRWSELIRRIQPWMVRLETAFSLLLPRPRYIKFVPDAYLRADTKTRYETYKIGIDSGVLEVNEARNLEDRPPIEEPPPPTPPPVPPVPPPMPPVPPAPPA